MPHKQIYLPPKRRYFIYREPKLKRFQDDRMDISIPGLQNALNPKSSVCARVFWWIIIGCCAVLAVYQIVDRFQLYFAGKTILDVQIFPESQFQVPNITICPGYFNYFRKIKINDALFGESAKDFNLQNLWDTYTTPTNNIEINSTFDTLIRLPLQRPLYTLQSKMINITTFFGRCTTICFTERLGYLGIRTKLSITIPFGNLVVDSITTLFAYLKHKEDIDLWKYFLHSGENFPIIDAYLYSRYITVSSDVELIIQMQTFKRLNKKEQPCSNDEEIVAACWESCFYKSTSNLIKCSLPFRVIPGFSPCNLSETMYIIHTIDKHLMQNETSNCKCPQKCSVTHYSIREKQKPLSKEYFNKLTLKFEDNAREVIEEKYAYTRGQLLSDVGGNLGLFLGCCVLTFMEIFQALILHFSQY